MKSKPSRLISGQKNGSSDRTAIETGRQDEKFSRPFGPIRPAGWRRVYRDERRQRQQEQPVPHWLGNERDRDESRSEHIQVEKKKKKEMRRKGTAAESRRRSRSAQLFWRNLFRLLVHSLSLFLSLLPHPLLTCAAQHNTTTKVLSFCRRREKTTQRNALAIRPEKKSKKKWKTTRLLLLPSNAHTLAPDGRQAGGGGRGRWSIRQSISSVGFKAEPKPPLPPPPTVLGCVCVLYTSPSSSSGADDFLLFQTRPRFYLFARINISLFLSWHIRFSPLPPDSLFTFSLSRLYGRLSRIIIITGEEGTQHIRQERRSAARHRRFEICIQEPGQQQRECGRINSQSLSLSLSPIYGDCACACNWIYLRIIRGSIRKSRSAQHPPPPPPPPPPPFALAVDISGREREELPGYYSASRERRFRAGDKT